MEPKISVEAKKAEAIERMKLLRIFPQTIQQFAEEGFVSISEPPYGAFFWAAGEDLERIQKFERTHNAVVYVVIRSYTSMGKLDSFLFVSDYREEWPADRAGLKRQEALAYVYNYDDPICSELGYIGFKRTIAAGLAQTW